MELFIPSFIFNPQLAGHVVRASGYDEEGYLVDITGIVERAEAEALIIRRGSVIRTIHAHEVGLEGIRLDVAGEWAQLLDNRPPEDDGTAALHYCPNRNASLPPKIIAWGGSCEKCGWKPKMPKTELSDCRVCDNDPEYVERCTACGGSGKEAE